MRLDEPAVCSRPGPRPTRTSIFKRVQTGSARPCQLVRCQRVNPPPSFRFTSRRAQVRELALSAEAQREEMLADNLRRAREQCRQDERDIEEHQIKVCL